MNLTLQPSATGPLYRQVFESLRLAIANGQLESSQRLPATRELALQIGVSRNTINTAYDMLEAEGYICAKRGSGFFVAEQSSALLKKPNQLLDRALHKRSRISFSARGQRMIEPPKALYAATENIAFTPGLPDLEAFPFKQWQSCMSAKTREATTLLGYQHGAGYRPLLAALADYLQAHRGVTARMEQIVITSGSQSGLDLLASALTDEGDRVAIEEPGYMGAKTAFSAAGVKLSPIQVDTEGLRVDLLAKAHRRTPVKLVFTTPSHQFPTGVTMSLNRRLELLQWAEENDVLVIEDDYDSEYRYRGRPISSMQGLKPERVLYMGTFSKVMFPALRIGYMVLPEQLAKPLAENLYKTGHEASPLIQATIAEFMRRGYFVSHLRKMRKLYGEKQQRFISLAEQHLSKWLHVEANPAGMQLTCYYSNKIDEAQLMEAAKRVGVTLLTLSPFYERKATRKGLFIGYTAVPLEKMEANVLLLKKVFSQVC